MKIDYIDFGDKLNRIAWMIVDGVRLINTTYKCAADAPLTLATFVDGEVKYERLEVLA